MLLGIDVGTSSIKGMVMEEDGKILAVCARNYDVSFPRANQAEQDPRMWWEGLCQVMEELGEKCPKMKENLRGIGLSGQMHGLVAIDKEGTPVRPAIIWMDQRATKELEEINEKIPTQKQGEIFHNRVFNGFALPSLLWVKQEEPEVYEKIDKIFQPKDYIRYCMTGEAGTEESDSSAALLMNVGKRDWAWEELELLEIRRDILPSLGKSWEIAGRVTEKAGKELGIRGGIPVVYGAGDQQAQSIGNGAVREGLLISNIGTGAQVSCYSKKDRYDKELRTHTFCHGIPDGYTIYGAMLSGGMSLKWMKNNILQAESFDQLSAMASETAPGSEGVIFLPYLSGERTPLMNPRARGMFFGLSIDQDRRHLTRAVMEGVTYALKSSLDILQGMGIDGKWILASGGAAQSPVWLQIQADILEKEVQVCKVKEQACLGACILAGVGCGIYADIEQACEKLVSYEDKIYLPTQKNQSIYREQYGKFQGLYENTKKFL